MSAAALTCFYSWSSTLPPPRSLAATVTRVQRQQPHPPRSQHSDPLIHLPPSPSTRTPASALLTRRPRCQLLSTSWPALPQQPNTPPGPLSIIPTLPLTFAFDPLGLHLLLSVLNLPVVGYTKTVTFVACSTAPNPRVLVWPVHLFVTLACDCCDRSASNK